MVGELSGDAKAGRHRGCGFPAQLLTVAPVNSRGFLTRWLINSVGILFAANVLGPARMSLYGPVPALELLGPVNAILAGLLLALLNATLKPVLVLLTLPLNILSLGLFTFVINGALMLLVSKMLRGFIFNSLWSAILASVIVSVISLAVTLLVKDEPPPKPEK